MASNFDTALAWLLSDEGGYVNNPSDPGGMTNLGVTARVWRDFNRMPTLPGELVMRALTPADVRPLYLQRYWAAVNGNKLPSGLDYAVFDFAVNSGPVCAARELQALLGVDVDGNIGVNTVAAAQAADPQSVIERYCAARIGFLKALPGWETFGDGWGSRVQRVEARALTLLGNA